MTEEFEPEYMRTPEREKPSEQEVLRYLKREFIECTEGFGANVSPSIPRMKTLPNGRKSYAQGGLVYPMTPIPDQEIRVSLEDY